MKIKGIDLKKALRIEGLTQEDAALKLGMSRQTLSTHLRSAELSDVLIKNVKERLGINLQNVKTFIVSDLKAESNAIEIGEIPGQEELNERTTAIGNNRFLKLIPLVPLDIHAGYVEHFNDIVYINQAFEPFPFIATSQGRGNYIAFIIKGNSMDDGTSDGITEGSIVVGREIQKHHWRNKLHLTTFQDYVIIHKEIMTCKRIIEHDTENGIIYCTSINPDKKRYKDFDLQLDDCLQIFNIVSVTKTR